MFRKYIHVRKQNSKAEAKEVFLKISMARESKLPKKYSEYYQDFVASILKLSKTLLSILMMVKLNFLSKQPRDSLRRQFTFNH